MIEYSNPASIPTDATKKYRPCPLWVIANAIGAGPRIGSDRCSPKCHLFDQAEGDCVFHIINRRIRAVLKSMEEE